MNFIMHNDGFTCIHCKKAVKKHPTGSARNHCPYCLCSLHVDDTFPGDRAADCGGIMRPIDFVLKKHKGAVLLHQCERCGKEITNIPAPDDDLVNFSLKIPEERLKRQKGRHAYESGNDLYF